jgi:hypothetical protein
MLRSFFVAAAQLVIDEIDENLLCAFMQPFPLQSKPILKRGSPLYRKSTQKIAVIKLNGSFQARLTKATTIYMPVLVGLTS